MKTKERIEMMIARYRDGRDAKTIEELLEDIEVTLRSSVMLVQDLSNDGLYAELHENRQHAEKSLAEYVRSQWCCRDGPGKDVPIPEDDMEAIDTYHNPDDGDCCDDSYIIIGL